jgi:hypothetical protein
VKGSNIFLLCAMLDFPLLLWSISASAQLNNPYDPANHARGVAAYNSKQYVDALHFMQPFPSRGDPEAEFIVGNVLADGLAHPAMRGSGCSTS